MRLSALYLLFSNVCLTLSRNFLKGSPKHRSRFGGNGNKLLRWNKGMKRVSIKPGQCFRVRAQAVQISHCLSVIWEMQFTHEVFEIPCFFFFYFFILCVFIVVFFQPITASAPLEGGILSHTTRHRKESFIHKSLDEKKWATILEGPRLNSSRPKFRRTISSVCSIRQETFVP